MSRHRRIVKSITLITLVSFVFSIFSPMVPLPSVLASTKEPFPAKRTERIELQDYRTSNSKRFLNPDGMMTEEIYLGNIHYRQGNKWVDIDNNMVSSTTPGFKYKNKSNRFNVEFAEHTNGNQVVRYSMGDQVLEMRPLGLLTKPSTVQNN